MTNIVHSLDYLLSRADAADRLEAENNELGDALKEIAAYNITDRYTGSSDAAFDMCEIARKTLEKLNPKAAPADVIYPTRQE